MLVAGLYAGGTLAAFTAMRGSGLGVRYVDIAWPPAWRHFNTIRGRHYLATGRTALANNHIAEANVALNLAYEFDPSNYEAGLTLAQIWQSGQAARSDQIYVRLLREHPTEASQTARAWAQALLWRGDFGSLAALAGARLINEPPPGAAWLHALIFSARRLHDPGLLAATLATPNLPAETRSILRLEAAALGGDAAGTARILAAPLSDAASAYARYYQVNFLTEAGQAARALELLTSYGDKLPSDERIILSCAAQARLGNEAVVRREAEALLRANPKPRMYEILAAHLIRYPDTELLRLTCGQIATMPWAYQPEGSAANAALLCAAGINRVPALLDANRTRLRRTLGAKAAALNRADNVFNSDADTRQLGNFLPALPMLPLEVIYALFSADPAAPRQRRQP